MPLATHWSAWWRYSVLGRRKSGIGATIWGAWFPKRRKNAKNNVFFDFKVFNGQKNENRFFHPFYICMWRTQIRILIHSRMTIVRY